jgi:hypothetical protein
MDKDQKKKKRKLIINKETIKDLVLREVSGGAAPPWTSTRPCSEVSCWHDSYTNCLS